MLHNIFFFKGTRKVKGNIKTAVQYTALDDAIQIDNSTGLQKHRWSLSAYRLLDIYVFSATFRSIV